LHDLAALVVATEQQAAIVSEAHEHPIATLEFVNPLLAHAVEIVGI